MAYIHSITYRPIGQDNQADQFVRVAVKSAHLIAGHGIEGDAKAGRHPDRQLNLLSYAWLLERGLDGLSIQPGDFGEQMVIQGLAVENLQPGDHLQIGTEAEIEITKPRTTCKKLEMVQSAKGSASTDSVGMLAKVVVGGSIRVGDLVRMLVTA